MTHEQVMGLTLGQWCAMLTEAEVCRMVNKSHVTLYNWRKDYDLPYIMADVGCAQPCIRYPAKAVVEWCKANEIEMYFTVKELFVDRKNNYRITMQEIREGLKDPDYYQDED